MKARFYEEGARYGRRLAAALAAGKEEGETMIVGDCSLAGLRVLKENGQRMLHPAELLAQAYGVVIDEAKR
jgi:glycerol-3-phosphate dehydrogenase subunit C